VEGDFPEDEQEREDMISELADEGFEKDKGTEPIVTCLSADMHWD